MPEWHLFLDDMRDPHCFPRGRPALPRMRREGPFVLWTTHVEQAFSYLDCYGPPTVMYLDHDMGQYSGMDFLKGVQEKYPLHPPHTVHWLTANPIGKANMQAFVKSWRKSAEA